MDVNKGDIFVYLKGEYTFVHWMSEIGENLIYNIYCAPKEYTREEIFKLYYDDVEFYLKNNFHLQFIRNRCNKKIYFAANRMNSVIKLSVRSLNIKRYNDIIKNPHLDEWGF